MRNWWKASLVTGSVLLLAGSASAVPMTIDWNVTFTSDAGLITLGAHQNAGVIDVDGSDSLVSFLWNDIAVIDSAVDTVNLLSVTRDFGGDVVGVDLFGQNATFDSVSLSSNGNLSNFFSFSVGGVSASGTYALAAVPMPEPGAAMLFGIGILVVASASRRPSMH